MQVEAVVEGEDEAGGEGEDGIKTLTPKWALILSRPPDLHWATEYLRFKCWRFVLLLVKASCRAVLSWPGNNPGTNNELANFQFRMSLAVVTNWPVSHELDQSI